MSPYGLIDSMITLVSLWLCNFPERRVSQENKSEPCFSYLMSQ